MCGIAGILSPDVNDVSRERLQKMTDSLQHRGPDGDGFWINVEGTAGFGHRRLAIIDLTTAGAQPMHYLNRYSITFNGEIYNYVEIKDSLIKKGYQFFTHTDTEVLLAAYACYGRDCLQYFDGMFAFAIRDNHEKTVFCARDRFGEKPFFYHYTFNSKQFIFASEMKALWAAGIHKNMDNEMLLNYLTLGWVQNPVNKQQTFYEDIHSLPPAHYIFIKTESETDTFFEMKSYWDLDKVTKIETSSEAEINERFLHLFKTSVSRRLRSDVAIGSSVSGGLDSSSIVGEIKSILNGRGCQQTFSAVFPGFERDESKHIDELIRHLGIKNVQVSPKADDFISCFEKLVYHQEEPFQSSSVFAQFKVFELAKQHGVTVILDGQGADETMAGYTKYYPWYWQEMIADCNFGGFRNEMKLTRENGQKIKWSWKNYLAAWMPQLAANQVAKIAAAKQLHHPDITPAFYAANNNRANIFKPTVTNLNDVLYFNTMQFGLEELLRYADRNSMANSTEVRLPFLNHELVQFIFSLPSNFKINKGFTKYLLRQNMQSLLPPSIVWRKDKIGFEPPQQQWMNEPAAIELMMEGRKKLVREGILRPKVLQKPLLHLSAHDDENFDWRYLCASHCL